MGYDVLRPQPCACGCGQMASTDQRRNRISRYLSGHNAPNRGRRATDATRAKLRAAASRQINRRGGGPKPRPAAERFLAYVEIPATCWEWTGALGPTGYGQFNAGNTADGYKMVRAHRFAYELLIGPIPDDLELDHLCNNRRCVNPEHLEPVTHAENIRRAIARRADLGGQ